MLRSFLHRFVAEEVGETDVGETWTLRTNDIITINVY